MSCRLLDDHLSESECRKDYKAVNDLQGKGINGKGMLTLTALTRRQELHDCLAKNAVQALDVGGLAVREDDVVA